MSFEDSMIDDGFRDPETYLDYLMDEAERDWERNRYRYDDEDDWFDDDDETVYRNYHEFDSIDEEFLFGKYKGRRLCDVLEDDPSYVHWCMGNIDDFTFSAETIEKIKQLFPNFILPEAFIKGQRWYIVDEEEESDQPVVLDEEAVRKFFSGK